LSAIACVATKTQRFVNNNTFYSNYPKLKISISPEFDYIGAKKFKSEGASTIPEISIQRNVYQYNFVYKGLDNKIKKIMIIQLVRSSVPFARFSKEVQTKFLEYGKVNVDGKEFVAITDLVTFSKENLPTYCLVKEIRRIVGASGQHYLIINYFQDATDSEYPAHAWKDRAILTKKQLKYLKNFNKNFLSSFSILEQ